MDKQVSLLFSLEQAHPSEGCYLFSLLLRYTYSDSESQVFFLFATLPSKAYLHHNNGHLYHLIVYFCDLLSLPITSIQHASHVQVFYNFNAESMSYSHFYP